MKNNHMKKQVKPTDEHYNELAKKLIKARETGDTQKLRKLHEELKAYGDKVQCHLVRCVSR